MKTKLTLVTLLSLLFASLQAQVSFNQWFEHKTLRIDYILSVKADTIIASLEQLKEEGPWAGTISHLIDPFNYGNYRIAVYDSATNKLIYTNGYSALSNEYQSTPEAKKYFKTFYESVNIPYPKKTVKFILYQRDKHMNLHTLLERYINPKDIFISREKTLYHAHNLIINGDINHKVDLVIIGDGYTENQEQEFEKEAEYFIKALFSYEPFKTYKDYFNVRTVFVPSPDSGTDIPGQNVWRNTVLNSHFYTFGIERYLTTEDYKTVKDIAAAAPYDQIIVLVNTDKYGGGGFYNYINLTAAKNPLADRVFVHEFGHAFAGLADEYWTSDVAVEDYYDTTKEPWEPNITTLVNFDSKWKDMVADTVPIPTPSTPEYKNVVGAFEGGGYVPKGIYRPMQNCLMRSLSWPFCKVCQRSIEQIIKYYSE